MKRIKLTQVFFIGILLIFVILLVQYMDSRDTTKVDLVFKGESTNWKAECYVSGSFTFHKKKDKPVEYESNSMREFMLSFKGQLQELSSAEDFSYSYKLEGSKFDSKEPYPNKTMFKHKRVGFPIYNINEDSLIEVTVNWNGNSESFLLNSTKK